MFANDSFPPGSFYALKSLDLKCTLEVAPCIALWNTCLVRQLTSLSMSFPILEEREFTLLAQIVATNSPQISALTLQSDFTVDGF